jgi:hypothetical protein
MDGTLRLLKSGTKLVTASATPEALYTTDPIPIGRMIWVGAAYVLSGDANTETVMVGNVSGQYRTLAATNYEGFWIPCGDPSKVFVKVHEDGAGIDGVNYEVWG